MTRRVAIAALVIAGCAGGAPRVSPAPNAASDVDASVSTGGASEDASPSLAATNALASLVDVAARALQIAPGLREAARFELAGDASGATRTLIESTPSDTCARVAVVASPAVHVSLVDAHGNVLADAVDVTDAPLAARGPVCVRRGETITLRIDAKAPFTARVVAWSSR